MYIKFCNTASMISCLFSCFADRKVHFVYVLVEVRHRWNKVGSVLGLKDADMQVITKRIRMMLIAV